MEEDARRFLLRVVRSISMGLLWLLTNMTLGIYMGLLLFHGSPSLANIIFYVWLLGSLGLLILYLYRIWTREEVGIYDEAEHNRDEEKRAN